MFAAVLGHLVQDFRDYEYVYYTAGNGLEKPVLILEFIYSLAMIFKVSQPFSPS